MTKNELTNTDCYEELDRINDELERIAGNVGITGQGDDLGKARADLQTVYDEITADAKNAYLEPIVDALGDALDLLDELNEREHPCGGTGYLTDEERATLSESEQDALFETRSEELNTKANAARDIVDQLLLDLDDRDRLEAYTGGYTVLRVDYENNSEDFWDTSEWFAARCRAIYQEDDGSKLVLTDEDGDEIVDRLESAPGWNDDAAPTYAPHPVLIELDATRERLSEIFAEL